MGGVFRVERPDGSVEFTDVPSGPGRVQHIRPGATASEQAAEQQQRQYDHKLTERLIKEAQKRIPKLQDYWDYIEYLRHSSPARHRHMLLLLKEEDPKAWIKLQRYPAFRPLGETALGWRAADKHLAAGIEFAAGKYTGSVEKWLETTVKDMMKQQGWGPYDVLGRKASTLAASKPPYYSPGRAGQFFKAEDASAAAAARKAAQELESGSGALRAARGRGISGLGGTAIDFGLAALNPETATSLGINELRVKARTLYEKGVLDVEQWAQTQTLLSQRRYVEMQKLMADATAKFVNGR